MIRILLKVLPFSFVPVFKRLDNLKEVLSNKLRNAKPKILEEIEAEHNRQIDSRRKAIEKAPALYLLS